MNIHQYLKQLTGAEREALAIEIDCSRSYLNNLASSNGNPSIGMVFSVYISRVNKKLHKEFQFTEDDYVQARKTHNERVLKSA